MRKVEAMERTNFQSNRKTDISTSLARGQVNKPSGISRTLELKLDLINSVSDVQDWKKYLV